jgi:AbrB family looped-hinge helix DNA binding protein
MRTYKVDSRGRITLPKYILRHLGVEPGGAIEFELLPNDQGALMRARPSKKVDDFFVPPSLETREATTINETNDAVKGGAADK